MSHPHTTQADRDALDDLGLVDDDDHTEMLKAPGLPPQGLPNQPNHQQVKGSSTMSVQPPAGAEEARR